MPGKCSVMSYDDVVCGVITIDAGSSEEAERQARVMRRCPKCLAVGTTGNSVIGVYLAPREGAWWLNYLSLFPDRKSSVLRMEKVVYPEALTVEPSEAVPCGAS